MWTDVHPVAAIGRMSNRAGQPSGNATVGPNVTEVSGTALAVVRSSSSPRTIQSPVTLSVRVRPPLIATLSKTAPLASAAARGPVTAPVAATGEDEDLLGSSPWNPFQSRIWPASKDVSGGASWLLAGGPGRPEDAARKLAQTILQGDVSNTASAELIGYLGGKENSGWGSFSGENFEERMRAAAYLTMATPAYQLA